MVRNISNNFTQKLIALDKSNTILGGYKSRIEMGKTAGNGPEILQGSCANFGIQNPDFIQTKKSVFPFFQKPIKWPGNWVWP